MITTFGVRDSNGVATLLIKYSSSATAEYHWLVRTVTAAVANSAPTACLQMFLLPLLLPFLLQNELKSKHREQSEIASKAV